LLCQVYDIDPEEYKSKVGAPLLDKRVAMKDNEDTTYMPSIDKIWIASVSAAKELGRTEALWQFEEQVTTFGAVDWLFQEIFWTKGGIFNRFYACYTWSRWDEALFLPKIPQINSISTFTGIPSVKEQELLKKAARGISHCGFKIVQNFSANEELAVFRYLNFDESCTWHASQNL
jgi:hypothetical protein